MTPAVSILTTVFNGEKFLAEAVASMLEQSYSNFEFLIIDDGSTDRTPEIASALADHDRRIRVLRNDVNLGQTRSLCKGLAGASGEYIARLDADDVALPDRLKIQHRFLEANRDVAVLAAGCELIDDTGQLTGDLRPGFDEPELLARIMFYNPIIHSSVMFRKNQILEIGGYNAEYTRAQDYDLWLRCLASDLRITACPDVLVHQRMHETRVTCTQPGVMEQFRKSALRNGWKSIVGIDVPDWILEETSHLLWTHEGPRAASFTSSCIELRRLRLHFVSRFRANQDAVEAFDLRITRIVSHLCKSFDVEPILYQKYVLGLPYPRVAIRFSTVSTALKKSAQLVESFKRSWFYNCRPMRWIRSHCFTKQHPGIQK